MSRAHVGGAAPQNLICTLVGTAVGSVVGTCVGAELGGVVGVEVGVAVGTGIGTLLGGDVGTIDGWIVGGSDSASTACAHQSSASAEVRQRGRRRATSGRRRDGGPLFGGSTIGAASVVLI